MGITSTTRARLPLSFEPLTNNRWVLVMGDIDAVLVKSIQPPVFAPKDTSHKIIVSLHNVVGVDQNKRLKAWLDSTENRQGELKFLDRTGRVVELWRFSARPVKVWFDVLDYGDVNPTTTYVELKTGVIEIITINDVVTLK